jgi:abequosyltransferase
MLPKKILLTIAIPTYNRAQYLEKCLMQIINQLDGIDADLLEILVSDNHSSDETELMVKEYLNRYPNLRYMKNSKNIGPDRNISQCFLESRGKYVLILGDDDIISDDYLKVIFKYLLNAEYGVIHYKSYSFREDYKKEKPMLVWPGESFSFTQKDDFIDRTGHMLTFISSNIINKDLIKNEFVLDDNYLETNLVQLSWTLMALMRARKNLLINQYLIASISETNRGYPLFNVFGNNLNQMFTLMSLKLGMNTYLDVINSHMIKVFFPFYIIQIRSGRLSFIQEDMNISLKHVFSDKILYRLILRPLISLPLPMAKVLYKLLKCYNVVEKGCKHLKDLFNNKV